jgi:hypothetical protein
LRSAEFGFFGVVVYTLMQTPRFWGQLLSAGLLVLLIASVLPFLTSWLIVGTSITPLKTDKWPLQKNGQSTSQNPMIIRRDRAFVKVFFER